MRLKIGSIFTYISSVKFLFKQNISKGLMLLVIYIQVVLPFFQNIGENKVPTSSLGNIHQVSEEEGLYNSAFILSDQVDVFSSRVEISNSLFYTLTSFSLDAFHNLYYGIKQTLSALVNITFTIADKIFPFACFW